MKSLLLLMLSLLFCEFIVSVDSLTVPSQTRPSSRTKQRTWNGKHIHLELHATNHIEEQSSESIMIGKELSRRNLLRAIIGTVTTASFVLHPNNVDVANAIPMVSTDEFNTIIRDSARSIEMVEFSGPKSETVIVILVDGTSFGLSDVIESSTDPRSPLKVAAMCKANQIPYKFVNIEALLNASPRKKKVYANARVLEAAEKEKEKAIRMEQDEIMRQQQLRDMQ